MKKIYLIHGWGEHPNGHFFPWLKKELQKNGFKVIQPQMPNTETPKIKEWVDFLSELVGIADKNTFFVGHSIGCQTILRYLENQNKKIGGVVFVAGWFDLDNLESLKSIEIAKPWINNPINFEKIKDICSKITVFLSSNEPYNFVEKNKRIFQEKLNAKVYILENKGHFCENDGVTKLPEVLQALKEMIK
mgnify:CR=1 FL=1